MAAFDVIIIGAGVVGASLAWRLAPSARVVVVEAEDQPGYHSTGRSAAHYTDVIGGGVVQALSAATRPFLEDPPPGFTDVTLIRRRPVLLLLGTETRNAAFTRHGLSHVIGHQLFELDREECLERCPVLKPEMIESGLWEPAAGDIDVHAIHGAYLRAARASGASMLLNAPVSGMERRSGVWHVSVPGRTLEAPIVANCAGAWGDVVGRMAGAAPVGLVPKRRTAFTFRGPDGMDHGAWPLVADDGESFYFKPEAGLILGSLADEQPSEPCDAAPEELDLALAAHRIMEWTTLDIRRMESRWAGLRSFVPDRLPVTGFDPACEGFFWNVGQGGAGIQTSTGLSAYAAAVMLGNSLPPDLVDAGLDSGTLSPSRMGGAR
ncbi:MAG: FAD-binding oxidoreductase [bacterium]|nr:FAD-binding oxidoreductase [bacterium]MDE0416156.1 FAD-binding oxidoreductase [bacterium]